jgi:hypothetical protein
MNDVMMGRQPGAPVFVKRLKADLRPSFRPFRHSLKRTLGHRMAAGEILLPLGVPCWYDYQGLGGCQGNVGSLVPVFCQWMTDADN